MVDFIAYLKKESEAAHDWLHAGASFLLAPLALALGIGIYLFLPTEPSPFLAPILLPLTLVILLPNRHSPARKALFLVALGFILIQSSAQRNGTPVIESSLGARRITGVVETLEKTTYGHRVTLANPTIDRITDDLFPKKIQLTLSERFANQFDKAEAGQTLTASATLHPFPSPDPPEGYDLRRHNYFKGIGGSGSVMGKIELSPQKNADENNLTHFLTKTRTTIQERVFKVLKKDAAGLSLTLLTGNTKYLSQEIQDAMRIAGLSHILSISGLHIGLIAGLIFFTVRAILALSATLTLYVPIKKIAAFLAIPSVAIYTLLVESPIPAQRALIMTSLIFLGIMMDRIALSLRSIALAALLILTLWPEVLVTPSFQLSFAAITALIAFQQSRTPSPTIIKKALNGIKDLAIATLIATIATLPFTLYHFHQCGLYAVLANALAVPLTSFWLMPFTLLTFLSMPFNLETLPLKAMGMGADYLSTIAHTIANWPYAQFTTGSLSFTFFLTALFGGTLACLSKNKTRWIGTLLLITSCLTAFLTSPPTAITSDTGRSLAWKTTPTQATYLTLEDYPNKGHLARMPKILTIPPEGLAVADPETHCTEDLCELSINESKKMALTKTPKGLDQACEDKETILIISPDHDLACSQHPAPKVLTFDDFAEKKTHALWLTEDDQTLRFSTSPVTNRPWTTNTQSPHLFHKPLQEVITPSSQTP